MEDRLKSLYNEKQGILDELENAISNQKQNQLQSELYEVEHSIKILESYDSQTR